MIPNMNLELYISDIDLRDDSFLFDKRSLAAIKPNL